MVQIKVKEGVLEGEEVQNEYGGKFYSFKGIPYAEPPIGDLRFKAPKNLTPWDGVRSAKKFGPICYQTGFFERIPPTGSEDCLYLNVYTPDIKPKTLLPVMFWIHGGGFQAGSGNDDLYGSEFLVSKGVILVTINYRLGVLGFLSLGTKDIPGNAGMKDQVAALKWVKENIAHFGGNPNNITLFGESAGAISISFHLVSPMSKGLFKRAITQSGTSFCWAASFMEPSLRARAIARELGCSSDDDKDIYEFFKTQSVDLLVDNTVPLTYAEKNKEGSLYIYRIVKEEKFKDIEAFCTQDIFEAVRNGAVHEDIDVINGYTEDEGVLYFFNNNWEKILEQANKFPEFFVPSLLAINLPITEQLHVGRKIKSYYFKDNEVTKENIDELVRYFNFEMFVCSSILWQKFYASLGKNKIYLYKFTCKSNRNIFGHVYKTGNILNKKTTVAHGDDLSYLFPCKAFSQRVDTNSKAFKMIEQVTTIWTNFAKYGEPTPDDSLGVKWTPYTLENQEYLDIGESLVPRTVPEQAEMEFWESIFRKYYPKLVL